MYSCFQNDSKDETDFEVVEKELIKKANNVNSEYLIP